MFTASAGAETRLQTNEILSRVARDLQSLPRVARPFYARTHWGPLPVRFTPMRRVRRTIFALTLAISCAMLVAPVAMGADGEGLYGRTDDKVITFFSFGVIVFFAALVIVLSIVQARLEGRKERVREDIERLRRP
jgi:putative copper export protein